MTLTCAVGALEDAESHEGHPLCDEAFVDALTRLIPCDGISLLDLDVANRTGHQVVPLLMPSVSSAGIDEAVFWDHFHDSLPCSYTERGVRRDTAPRCTSDFYDVRSWHATGMYAEYFRPAGIEWDLIVPLPGPPGLSRRLVLFRAPGTAFTGQDAAAARVLRPHVVDALRGHHRRNAVALLTPRQRELVSLCALGMDNTRIARALGMSSATVRKHLENVFDRLQVRSRSEAVAATRPDLAWC